MTLVDSFNIVARKKATATGNYSVTHLNLIHPIDWLLGGRSMNSNFVSRQIKLSFQFSLWQTT
jgi:hypothetical protein